MSSKKIPQEENNKRRKIIVEMKHKIIQKQERGVSLDNLALTYNRSTSTICKILKNKDRIKKIDASKGMTRILSMKRLRILVDVERLFLIWINENQLQGNSVKKISVKRISFVNRHPQCCKAR
ncbi:hypothetical protein AVEN_230245-1 [Araneus ventricosus]|uniref:Uncharacterized protein n=1 Tax=Araneus ventricosus TaxID=182803 RepID=A0A4Y2DV65_ARAVE|nr:hypothetical protein AVEN_230245-1 [Araneus ventricosus]